MPETVSAVPKQVIVATYLDYIEGRWERCLAGLRQLVSNAPEDFTARMLMGDALARQGNVEAARAQYIIAAFGFMRRNEEAKVQKVAARLEDLDG